MRARTGIKVETDSEVSGIRIDADEHLTRETSDPMKENIMSSWTSTYVYVERRN